MSFLGVVLLTGLVPTGISCGQTQTINGTNQDRKAAGRGDSTGLDRESADLLRLGVVHYQRREWDFAIQRFRALMSRDIDVRMRNRARFFLAESLVAKGLYLEARRHLEEFLRKGADPSFAARARYRLGEISYLLGDPEAAFSHLTEFVTENPEHSLGEYALPYLGESALKTGRHLTAVKRFQESLKKYPQGALADEARFGLARALEKNGSTTEALRFYQYLVEHPGSKRVAEGWFQIGKLHFREHRYEQAAAALDEFIQQFPEHALINPARYWRARIAMSQKDHGSAAKFLQLALKDSPRPEVVAALRYELARCLVEQDRFADAIAQLKVVSVRYPDSDWADDCLLLNIQILRNHDQFRMALPLCEEFRRRFRDSDLLPLMLESEVACLFGAGLYRQAEVGYQQLLELTARRSDLPEDLLDRRHHWKYELAICQLKQDRKNDALRSLEAIDLDDCDARTRRATTLALATLQIERNRLAEATRNLIDHVEQTTDEKDRQACIHDIALLLAKRNDFQRADQWLARRSASGLAKTAIQLAETAYAAEQYRYAGRWFDLAARNASNKALRSQALMGSIWSMRETGNHSGAIASARRLVESFPDSEQADDALYLLGVLYDRMGDQIQASTAFRQVITRYPESEHVPTALLALCNRRENADSDHNQWLIVEMSRALSQMDLAQRDRFLYELGWLLLKNGQKNRARQSFETLCQEYPQSPFVQEAALQVAESWLGDGKPDTARPWLQRVIDAGPDSQLVARASYHLAKLAFEEKNYDQAIRQYDRICQRFPESTLVEDARFWKAESMWRAGRFESAAAGFESIVQGDGNFRFQDLAVLRLAQIRIKQEKWNSAIELASRLAEHSTDPGYVADAWFVVGRARFSLGQFAKAREALTKVLNDSLANDSEIAAMAQWYIGESWFHQEEFDKAIDAYQRTEILHAWPQWQAAAILQAGKCFEQKKQLQKAVENYRRVVQEHAATRFAGEAKARLVELNQVVSSARATNQSNNNTDKQR